MRILAYILTAALALGQFPVELMRKPGLSRSGLAMGANVTGGVDTQSIASIPPGTGSIVRGANTGAASDDPVVSLLGWTFDGVNDLASGLPAKGSVWTTINCSGTACHGVDSAGGKYINGVPNAEAVEFNIGTAGGYTGVLTRWYRYTRVLGTGEHLNHYRDVRPKINAVGGTLP